MFPYLSPLDVPRYGSDSEQIEPLDHCRECGEVLTAEGVCDTCIENDNYHDACVLSGVPCATCRVRLARESAVEDFIGGDVFGGEY
jgi:hypothetical protein